jgi:hemoglobin
VTLDQHDLTEDTGSTAATPTAYEQIGGAAAVDAWAFKLCEYLLEDPETSIYFAQTDIVKHQRLLAAAGTALLGGPSTYDLASLGPKHKPLNIPSRVFGRVVTMAAGAMFALGVSVPLILAVGDALASLEPVLVNDSTAAAA